MASNFAKPVVTDAYATLLPGLVAANVDLACMLEPTLTGTSTNLPTGAVRWNAATVRWERYNGTSWVTLPSAGNNTYAINISGNAATATTSGACSGNAATATTASACSGNAANITGVAALANGGTGATTASSARAALGAAASGANTDITSLGSGTSVGAAVANTAALGVGSYCLGIGYVTGQPNPYYIEPGMVLTGFNITALNKPESSASVQIQNINYTNLAGTWRAMSRGYSYGGEGSSNQAFVLAMRIA